MDTGVSPGTYRPSADKTRLAIKAGRLALAAFEAGATEEDIFNALRAQKELVETAHVYPDLMCNNPDCEECYGEH